MNAERNKPCHCGSGRKYKKCHYLSGGFHFGAPTITKINSSPQVELLKQNLEMQRVERRKKLEQMGVFINFVVPIPFQGKKVWGLGSRLYPYEEENQTFHDFIMLVLKQELGREWWETQRILPENERHFIFECFVKHQEWKKKNQLPENQYHGVWRAHPDGYSRALLSLAFDVCSLLHAVHLPEVFLKKIRIRKSYQSVRYEIATAAIFARMGYEIQFLDEEVENTGDLPKHADFIAIHPTTGEKIVVEAKSKTRDGILHQVGEFNEVNELKSSVAKLYKKALKQRQIGKPFIIFIDMNLPLSPGVSPNSNPWVQTLTRMRDDAAFTTKGQKSPTNAIVFTNYSYHYGMEHQTGNGEWFMEKSGNPECLIQSPDFDKRFIPAIHNYGNVPNIDMSIET